ncbi:MAG: hypothetical protein OXR73_37610 [Myxococcales bacterium]|nr:hypothetical protein [Myxococcales bacterium]
MGRSEPWILGLSTTMHNGSACILKGSELIVAIQEERLSRIKRDTIRPGTHSLAIQYCLETAGITYRDLDLVVEAPLLAYAGRLLPKPMRRMFDLAHNPQLRVRESGVEVLRLPHHLAHAMSAYALSGFQEAAVLVADGGGTLAKDLPLEEQALAAADGTEGEGWEHLSLYAITPTEVRALEKHVSLMPYLDGAWEGMPPFASLGHMFSSAAYQIFGNYLDAGKVMGLAPYGRATTAATDFLTLENGRFRFKDAVCGRFRHADRWPLRKEEYEDLAASVQGALEATLVPYVRNARDTSNMTHLCYAGGVALNSIVNELLVTSSGFERVFVPPAAEDSGPAIGAAYWGLRRLRSGASLRSARVDSLGRTYDQGAVAEAARALPCVQALPSPDPLALAAERLRDGQIVAWFQGGSEFGPRALGQRSILCDPRLPEGKAILNARVKHREAFRPFAPVIMEEHLRDWFDVGASDDLLPHMLRICRFRKGKAFLVPAAVHVDGTGRVQSVRRDDAPRLWRLLAAFYKATGVPMLVNTSFNIMGEPIVESPADALWCLAFTDIDICVLGESVFGTRADFRTVLDLIPTRTQYRRRRILERVVGSVLPEDSLLFSVDTPYGSSMQPVERASCAVLKFVDGRRTGHQLLTEMRRKGHQLVDKDVARALGVLYRARLITIMPSKGSRAA